MEEQEIDSAASELPIAADASSPPSLDGLLKLLDSTKSIDPNLSAELAPLTRDLVLQIDPKDATLSLKVER
jgi:hypothetical protein